MPNAEFEKALPFVLRWEGGYVNHPADPGGATNKGVTQRVYNDWLKRQGRPAADVRQLADTDMQAIYESGYWKPAACPQLPEPLNQVHFDTAVNMGVGRAVRFLQEAVGAKVDGGFGPNTLACVQKADAGEALLRYLGVRAAFYRDLVERKPDLGVFLKGWMNRLNALRSFVGLPVRESAGVAEEAAGTARVPELDATVAMVSAATDEAAVMRGQAALLQEALATVATVPQRRQAAVMLLKLRNLREWGALRGLAESLLRVAPDEFQARRLYAQALIETGAVVPAVAVLYPMAANLRLSHREYGEAWGLLGRAHKQCFADLAGASVTLRREALGHAIGAYEVPYRADPVEHTWHGVNLLATVARARREGWADLASHWQVGALARALTQALKSKKADDWTLATLAEVGLAETLAGGDLSVVEASLRDYLTAPDIASFHVASTLRQFTEIWQLESLTEQTPGHGLRSAADVQRVRNLVAMLRARLLRLPKAEIDMPAGLLASPDAPPPPKAQLEAVLGKEGPVMFAWWLKGAEAARAVAVVRKRLGRRFGTGFLVRAGDLGLKGDAQELLLMTNFHVINPDGDEGALRPGDAEVVFEAADATRAYAVKSVVWSSPIDEHDACLLRLEALPPGVVPLAVSKELPPLPANKSDRPPRVYIIGHPGGRELSISMSDNELLDHEGPPRGKPANKAVCRVHYRTPTEGGSSGSPVFEDQGWKVIALHHAGGTVGMPRLNGAAGTYSANEGLAIGPLSAAAAAKVKP